MECRCYRGDKNRTKLVKLQYRGIDALWMLIGLIFLGSMIALKVLRGDIADLGGIYGIFFYKI